MHLPGLLYLQLPWIYVGAGVLALSYLPTGVGFFSGLLLVCAGLLVLLWRSTNGAKRRLENKAPQRKPRPESRRARNGRRRPGSTGGLADAGSRDEAVEWELMLARQMLGERRLVPDRRGWQPMPAAPFTDSKGIAVVRDRRHSPDRRTGSIQVKELG